MIKNILVLLLLSLKVTTALGEELNCGNYKKIRVEVGDSPSGIAEKNPLVDIKNIPKKLVAGEYICLPGVYSEEYYRARAEQDRKKDEEIDWLIYDVELLKRNNALLAAEVALNRQIVFIAKGLGFTLGGTIFLAFILGVASLVKQRMQPGLTFDSKLQKSLKKK